MECLKIIAHAIKIVGGLLLGLIAFLAMILAAMFAAIVYLMNLLKKMKATKEQKQYIYKLCGYNKELKEELVQWITEDTDKTSTNDLNFDQANAIIVNRNGRPMAANSWGMFDFKNQQHKHILSLCIQMDWKTKQPKTGRTVADINRLGEWLGSPKSPVSKPLKKMNTQECTTIINALKIMVGKIYKKVN